MEGKVSGEGLDRYEEDDDLITSLIRELLDEGRMGESADTVWASLASERVRLLGFGDSRASPIEAHDIDLGNQQVFAIGSSARSPWSAREVVEPEPGLWSTYKKVPVPVFTSSVRAETRPKPYPVRTHRRHLTHAPSGQLSFFEIPGVL